jgi:hypothetical protein
MYFSFANSVAVTGTHESVFNLVVVPDSDGCSVQRGSFSASATKHLAEGRNVYGTSKWAMFVNCTD